jgi:hypothetical protein
MIPSIVFTFEELWLLTVDIPIKSVVGTLILIYSSVIFLYTNFVHRLTVDENRLHRRIFGPKREEVTGNCRKVA